MRKLWRRIKFALTPKDRQQYQLHMYSVRLGHFLVVCTGTQTYIEYLAYCCRVNGRVHRVVRIK